MLDCEVTRAITRKVIKHQPGKTRMTVKPCQSDSPSFKCGIHLAEGQEHLEIQTFVDVWSKSPMTLGRRNCASSCVEGGTAEVSAARAPQQPLALLQA
jgi:hypothetical protein